MVGRRDHMSRHRVAMAHVTVNTPSEFINGVAHNLHGRLTKLGDMPRRCRHAGWTDHAAHDLEGASMPKLTGMIDADLMPTSHVSGSHQVGRIFHEVIIFTITVTRRRRGGAV